MGEISGGAHGAGSGWMGQVRAKTRKSTIHAMSSGLKRPRSPGAAEEAGEDGDAPAALPQPPRLCPYLDSVNRACLDFDFEKRCSISLSPLHVYACLVCGRFFQGRGPATHAYTHALEENHCVFMQLSSGRVFCLPDGYEVLDRSLDDVRCVLQPAYSAEQAAAAAAASSWSRALDGADFLPGLVGLNNLGGSDYAAAALQALQRVAPLRALLLRSAPPDAAQPLPPAQQLLARLGELTRRCWNARAFRGHVSPHELLQAVAAASARRFGPDRQADPVDFLAWLLNTLARETDAGPLLEACFRGRLRLREFEQPAGGAPRAQRPLPFLLLSLELPAAPLFSDPLERQIIPQVALSALLARYDGVTRSPVLRPRPGYASYALEALPPYLLLHVKRFAKNTFFVEKNPTLVTFPLRGLDLRGLLAAPAAQPPPLYDLVANIVHEGPPAGGAYRCQCLHQASGLWYEAADLSVTELLPQQVALSEAYVLLYERREAQAQA